MRDTGRLLLALLLLLPAALAGCLGNEDSSDQPDDRAGDAGAPHFVDFIVTDHEHEDPAAHTYSSPTMEQVAWHQLGEESAYSYLGEIDTVGELTAVAVVGQGSTPGFVLVDTSEPTAPEVLGRAEAPHAYAVDVKLTDDQQYALLATQQITTGRIGGTPTPETVEDGTYLSRNGIMVWDISDPTAPEMVSFAPSEAFGCHMMSIAEIDGSEWVFCINQSLTVFQLQRDGPAPALVQAGTYWPFGQEGYDHVVAQQNPLGATPHDMTFQADPVTGDPVLTVSHWDLGVRVLDVSIPPAPVELLSWAGEGAEHYQGYLHGAMLTSFEDTRFLVATPETLSDIVPAIWVLDASDYTSPELVAEWTNPGGHTSQGLVMTIHQMQVVGDRMFMTYNHNGIWVMDLAAMVEHGGNAPENAEILGVHLPQAPDEVVLYDRESYPMGIPAPWDLNVRDGWIFTADRYTGFYVLEHDGTPHTAAWTGFA